MLDGRHRSYILAFATLNLIACGRIDYDVEPGSDPDSGSPPDTDAAPTPSPWDGDFTMTTPELVSELNTATGESECYITRDGTTVYSRPTAVVALVSADGLEAYVHSTRAGGIGESDIWTVTRMTATGKSASPTRARCCSPRIVRAVPAATTSTDRF